MESEYYKELRNNNERINEEISMPQIYKEMQKYLRFQPGSPLLRLEGDNKYRDTDGNLITV